MLQLLRHLHPVLAEHLHPLGEVHLVGHQHAGQRARPEVKKVARQVARGSESESESESESQRVRGQRATSSETAG